MADRIVFQDDWFYFDKDEAKAKRGQRRPRDLVSIELPSKALRLTLAWSSQDETSCDLAQVLAATLYCIKEQWEFFLRMHLKNHSHRVVVFCDGREHAAECGAKTNWDFEEVPITYSASSHDDVDSEKRKQRIVFIRLILGDAQRTLPPGQLAQCALAWLNHGVLDKIGKIRNRAVLVTRFADAVREDVHKCLM